jgi:hypothetical protein
MANGIAFAAPLRKFPQAIDASAPSGTGGGWALSPEQRQERQCAFLGLEPMTAAGSIPVFPTEVVVVPRKSTRYRWGSPANSDSYASFAIGFRTRERLAALPIGILSSRTGLHGFCRARWYSDERCIERRRLEVSGEPNITEVLTRVKAYGSVQRRHCSRGRTPVPAVLPIPLAHTNSSKSL